MSGEHQLRVMGVGLRVMKQLDEKTHQIGVQVIVQFIYSGYPHRASYIYIS